jgi:DNA primase
MSLYTRDSIERVREAVDMVDLVSQKTDLRRVGSRWSGLCPFHDERSPSFNVNAEEKLYICFGCEAKGDAIRFVQETEGVDFREAVELLAERYGVELKLEKEDPEAEARRRRRERLLSLLDRTASFYSTYLWDSQEARRARDYLASRGLEEAVLREFRVGFSPSAWDRVSTAARRDGFTPEELQDSGLAMRSRQGPGLYDRFRGRIMFPLADARGRVLGFGARAMGEGRGPKYLNSSENAIFRKGHQLFGLDLARPHATKAQRVILVEGYTDVLALHQAGVREAVAIMGTALTQEQLGLLPTVAKRVILALDADRSGQEAMLRAAALANVKGLDLGVIALPEGKDPADLVAENGAEAFLELLKGAMTVLEFQVRRVLADADLETPAGRDRALEEARPLIAAIPPKTAMRDSLVRLVADRLDVPADYVTTQMASAPRHGAPSPPPPGGSVGAAALATERAFLESCLASGDLGRGYLRRLGEGHLSSDLTRRARGHLVEQFDDPLAGLGEDDPALAALVTGVVMAAGELQPATEPILQMSFLQLELRRIDREAKQAAEQGNRERQAGLAAERRDALREMESVIGQTA